MLTNWLTGKSADPLETATAEKPAASKRKELLDGDPLQHREPSESEKSEASARLYRKKLGDVLNEKPTNANNLFAYDNALRGAQRLLMESQQDSSEGLTVNVTRGVHNANVATKWQLGGQQANWEISLQTSGFSDLISASFSTLQRWQLMYQRTFSSGALLVAQVQAMPQMAQMGGAPGGFFGLIQYPWIKGGCSTAQYIKGQQIGVSHMQRVLRGAHVGALMTYDIATRSSSMAYTFHSSNQKLGITWAGEVKPTSGEWKLAVSKSDWANDVELCSQLEFTEKRNGPISLMSVGFRKNLIGGGHVSAVLSGFSRLRAAIETPYGGERRGFNQVNFAYTAECDLNSGDYKHGVTITY